MSTTSAVRQPVAAGAYYPADKQQLQDYITSILAQYSLPKLGKPFGMVAPLSPYKVAGKTYAATYSQFADEKIDTVVILSPLHKMSFDGLAFTSVSSFVTPLGEVLIDQECNQFLATIHEKYCITDDEYHAVEQAVEVQLPFLQVIFGKKIKIVPIIIGEPNTKITLYLAKALARMTDSISRKYMFIAATDLSRGVGLQECKDKDARFAEFFEKNHGDHLSEEIYMKQIVAFGGGGVVTLQRLSEIKGGKKTKVIYTDNSYNTTNDPYHVDGFCSAMWW